MKKTVAELRKVDVLRLAEIIGSIEEARYIMNCFYRMAAFYSRLVIIENDYDLYKEYSRGGRLDSMEEKLSNMVDSINDHLQPVGMKVNNESACSSIVYPATDGSGRIEGHFTLGHWYR